jgi:predicted ArsR family transcriptional regulator
VTDLPLFMRDAPHNGTRTSRNAAAAVRSRLPVLEGRVLVYLAGCPLGATNDELEVALKISGNTLRPRVVELRARGLIRDTGSTRKTRSGRSAIVWEITR